MPYVDVPVVTGAVMSWDDLASNFSDARDWLNEIPSSDFGSAVIQREHLVRPILQGFPVQGIRSSFQAEFRSTEIGTTPPTPLDFDRWGPKVNRLTIKPNETRGQTVLGGLEATRWVTPIGKTFYTPKQGSVTVICQFDLNVRSDPAGPYYPLGAAGELGGTFAILWFDSAQSEEELLCLRNIYPLDTAALAGSSDRYVERVSLLGRFTASAGHHDVALVYYRGTVADPLAQVDLTNVNLHT